MFCHNCGKEVGEIDAFCPFCGTPLNGNAPKIQAPEEAPPVQESSARPKMSALAVVGFSLACAALALGIASFKVTDFFVLALLGGIVGLILSSVGLVKNRKMGKNKVGQGLAIAGIVMNAVTIILAFVIILTAALAVLVLFSLILRLLGGAR